MRTSRPQASRLFEMRDDLLSVMRLVREQIAEERCRTTLKSHFQVSGQVRSGDDHPSELTEKPRRLACSMPPR